MSEEIQSAARERVLQVAERLFSERGYNSVTLRDIAGELGMKQSSLYNHAPGGKEELYLAVMERGLLRHKVNLERVMREAEPNLRAQLWAAARWLMSQPSINLVRMSASDLPSIHPDHAVHMTELSGDALFAPIMAAVEQAYRRGETRLTNPGTVAGAFLSLMDALPHSEQYSGIPKEVIANDVIDMLLDGLNRR